MTKASTGATAALPTVSLFPIDELRPREISFIADELAGKISWERHGDGSIEKSMRDFFSQHSIEADSALLEQLIDQTITVELSDRVYDSEADRAYRALMATFQSLLDCTPTTGYPTYKTLMISGLFPGEKKTIDGVYYKLNGKACPRCKINPQGYNYIGFVDLCVDTKNCGWRDDH